MTAQAAKAEQSFKHTCSTIGISEDGKRWLDLALDPFKDLNMPTAGYPDSVQTPSVVETVHQSIQITTPLTTADDWDCNIFLDQLYNVVPLFDMTAQNVTGTNIFAYDASAVAAGSRGGLQIRSGISGLHLEALNSQPTSSSLYPDIPANADIRIIAIGLEIHDTTAFNEKQGSVILYAVPDVIENSGVATIIANPSTTTVGQSSSSPLLELAEPPRSTTEAIDLPGSIQYEAREGAYIVPKLTGKNMEPQELQSYAVAATQEASGAPHSTDRRLLSETTVSTGTNPFYAFAGKNIVSPYQLVGTYFAGLKSTASLTVNLTYYVEIFPRKTNTLKRVTRPSPGTDAPALQLYADVSKQLPIGVPVKDNFLGVFMAGIARLAAGAVKYLPMVGKALGTAFQVAGGLHTAAQAIQEAIPSKEIIIAPKNDKIQITNNKGLEIVQVVPKNQSFQELGPNRNNSHRQMVVYNPNVNAQTNRIPIPIRTRSKVSRKKYRADIQKYSARNGNRWIQK
jgi:hypothetical protein